MQETNQFGTNSLIKEIGGKQGWSKRRFAVYKAFSISRGESRIFEGGVAGVEYGRAPKAPVAERRRLEFLGGSGGMPPREIFKSLVSEMAFPAF